MHVRFIQKTKNSFTTCNFLPPKKVYYFLISVDFLHTSVFLNMAFLNRIWFSPLFAVVNFNFITDQEVRVLNVLIWWWFASILLFFNVLRIGQCWIFFMRSVLGKFFTCWAIEAHILTLLRPLAITKPLNPSLNGLKLSSGAVK